MKRAMIQDVYTPVHPMRLFGKEMLPPPPPNRLITLITAGTIVEVVTIVIVLLTTVSGQFDIFSYILALLGILIPLFLAVWGFWLMAKDEKSAQQIMRGWERTRLATIDDEQHKPLINV